MPLAPGTRLGPYEIVAPIGAGGMGEVYRAKDPRLSRDVAVKVLSESLARDPQSLSRFEREAKAVASLAHPNILAIHDVAEALIGDLSHIAALRVVSRSSVMRYKGTQKSVAEVARELDVDTVLAGSVLRSGDQVRITVQLVDAAHDRTMWSNSYDGDVRGILALQREVARAVTQEIQVKLTPQEQQILAIARSVNPEAHDLYLRGLYHLARRAEENRDQALNFFLSAIEKDPTFARAHAALARTHGLFGDFAKMKEAARDALRLDDKNAEAYASLGYAKLNADWDWSGAEQDLRHAIELNPNSMDAHHYYSHFLTSKGRHEESLVHAKKAHELDPLNTVTSEHLGWASHFARQYDQAIEHYRRMLAMEPTFAAGHMRIAHTYEQKGMFAEAIAEFTKASELLRGQTVVVGSLAHALALAGRVGDARETLRRLESAPRPAAYDIAVVYVGLGDKEAALGWFEKAVEQRSNFWTADNQCGSAVGFSAFGSTVSEPAEANWTVASLELTGYTKVVRAQSSVHPRVHTTTVSFRALLCVRVSACVRSLS